jgi:hypothetical protein
MPPGKQASANRLRLHGQEAVALRALACDLAGSADRFGLLAGSLLGGLLVMVAKLHFAKDALALQLLLERPKGLIDIVVANENLHVLSLPKRVEPLQPSSQAIPLIKRNAHPAKRPCRETWLGKAFARRSAVIAQATIEIRAAL